MQVESPPTDDIHPLAKPLCVHLFPYLAQEYHDGGPKHVQVIESSDE
jgi:hypothetical protein